MKAEPIGGKLDAPLSPVGLFVFVDLIKFVILPLLYLSLQKIRYDGSKNPPLLPAFIIVVSINCFFLNLVKLYISLPTETLR